MIEKFFQTVNPSSNLREDVRRKNAVRINLATGILLLAVSTPGLFRLTPVLSTQYIGNITTAVMGLIALVCAWISYRYSSTNGSIAFIASLLIISLGIPIYANGLGLQAGIIAAAIVMGIATTTLENRLAARVSIVALIIEAFVIVMDLYLPDFGFGELESPYINPFLLIVLIIFVIFVFRRYGSYTLRTKLILAFVAIAMVVIGALGYFVNRSSGIRLSQDVGNNLTSQGNSYALAVGEILTKEVGALQAFSLSKIVQDRIEIANTEYTGNAETIQADIQRLDKQWRAADAANNDNDPLVFKVLNETISSELREYHDTFPENVEVFVTDRYGANVGSTNRTSDYYQADEAWWQTAYNNGAGAIYIGQPAFDESSSTYAANIAIPLYAHNTQKVIGVLRTTLKLSAIVDVLNGFHLGKTGQIELYVADGKEIPAEGGELVPGDPNALLLPADSPTYAQIIYDNAPSLVSRVPVTSSDPVMQKSINSLGWSLVTHQDRDESFAQVTNQTQSVILISILLLILAAIAAFFASQVIARPVQSLTSVAEQIAAGNLDSRAFITSQDEIGALANSFNRMTSQLQDTLGGLEKRVAERTADLEMARLVSERRAQELQSISEISRLVSSEQRLEILLPLVTRLVSERFDFYHVGIFFLDETRQFAILQASNSEGGQRMLERGHRLEVGQTGIVGNVALTGKTRIALDVGADAVFFDNPDLPGTRSEMALPLTVRREIIGVLDVQSTKPGAFTDSDANTLSILADQVAITIENARLFGQTQQSRDEAEALYNQFLRTEWKSFAQQETKIGYRQSAVGGKSLEAPIDSEEIRAAWQNGQVVVTDAKSGDIQPSIVVPVKLRGQTIGMLNIKAPTKNRKWNQDEINLAQAISDRLALALDNARLLQDSQRRAAKEQKIGEVTSKIGASINMRNVLQTAVEELGRALPGSEVIIQFQQEDGKS